ncbi:hypothetical protein BC939DRAFT_469914 [Gamsiella multidivaricata]|uniref:uncharacterized protein n=1 Tax=Gamsiella multidivaricata TaxID=101098 RepID=UPI00221EC197|nr:uncharacterized protein BC939DRAFT_469914 [Gamsiella multidivaricata]KAG0368590.1 hypothetical protein BGZ54_001617 [Gamsiella multidivaricata]KAI7816233.1 hypothetical protein BC939DRAFT_469914 [Gamsiella multidivaricata]
MKFSLKAVALGALLATTIAAAPVDVEKRDAASDRIGACFVGLIFTGAWPGSCQAAVAVNLGLIRSIAVNQMSMDFTPANPWAPTTSSNSIVATMISIPGITLPIDSVRQHIIIADNGVQIGNIDTPWSAASVKGGQLSTSFTKSTLNVFPNSHAAFSSFISSISTKASHPVTLQGSVDAKLNLGIFGHLTIPGIGFKATTPFAGLNGLSNTKYVYLIDVLLGEKFVDLTSVININNPSKLTLSLGDVQFSTASDKGFVGISTVRNLVLVPGDNYVLSYTALDNSVQAANDFMYDILFAASSLYMSGYKDTSANVALNAGLAVVKTSLVIPENFQGLTTSQPPYKDWSVKILPTTKTDKLIEITATFQSPYYGHAINMVFDNEAGMDNYATITAAIPSVADMRFFSFQNYAKFSVSGKDTVKVSFKAAMPGPFTADVRNKWQQLVNYGKTNGHIPIDFMWLPTINLDNDGIGHQVDWSNQFLGLGEVKVAVGSDFASVLDAYPTA